MTTSILFVCAGNICRSPLAEGIFLHLARARGVADRFDVDSAGTLAWDTAGLPADPRMRRVAAEQGVELGSIARRVDEERDFERFDLILCADEDNRDQLLWMGAPPARVRLLLAFDPNAVRQEVPDPYLGGEAGFRQVYRMVESACAALLDELLR